MRKVYRDFSREGFPVAAIHATLLKVLDHGGPAEVIIIGVPFSLRHDLALPLYRAQSPLTRYLLRKIEARGGKIMVAYR